MTTPVVRNDSPIERDVCFGLAIAGSYSRFTLFIVEELDWSDGERFRRLVSGRFDNEQTPKGSKNSKSRREIFRGAAAPSAPSANRRDQKKHIIKVVGPRTLASPGGFSAFCRTRNGPRLVIAPESLGMSSPSIVPGLDRDVYLVLDDFGRMGCAWRETDAEDTDLESVFVDLLEGQYRDPVRVIAFNPAEGWCRDVSKELARELRKRCVDQDCGLPASLERFLEMHLTASTQP
jgi:hypothetical protein